MNLPPNGPMIFQSRRRARCVAGRSRMSGRGVPGTIGWVNERQAKMPRNMRPRELKRDSQWNRLVYIRRAVAVETKLETVSESVTGGPKPCRVFVVEDEVMIRMLLEDMLADLGYEIVASAGGLEEAVGLARPRISTWRSSTSISTASRLPGGRNAGGARRALRLRHRLWRARHARALPRPADAEEAVPARRSRARAGDRRVQDRRQPNR